MARWDRLFVLLMGTVVGTASLGAAQEPAAEASPPAQTTEAPAPVQSQAPDPDLAAQVQQLRTDIDQLQNQVARLSSIVEQLQAARSEPEKITTPGNSKKKPPTAPKKSATVAAPPIVTPETDTPLTVLVFQDGHRTEARNYAIVGQTLWIYTEEESKKVPLADLDVSATKSANSDRGIVFQVPASK